MTTLFNRQAEVTLARPLTDADLAEPVIRPNAVIVKGLRVVCHAEKHLEKEPNTCELSIFNLAEGTRKEVQHKPLWVRIDAGYEGELRRVFSGDVRWAESIHDGVNWETRLQLGDGDRNVSGGARVSRSYRAGVDARTAVVEAARAMGLKVRLSPLAELDLRQQFAGGLVLTGPAHRGLSQVLDAFGMNWSIQDSTLQILRGDETVATEVVVVSQETGMVGTPAFGSPPEPGKKPILPVTKKLDARIKPGGRVIVKSRSIEGLFRCERVAHDFDTHGEAWDTQMELKAA